jgi:hypothetical protein
LWHARCAIRAHHLGAFFAFKNHNRLFANSYTVGPDRHHVCNVPGVRRAILAVVEGGR